MFFFTFKKDTLHFVFNTAKVSIYQVPKIIYDITEMWQDNSPENIIEQLGNNYERELLKKSITTIEQMGLLEGPVLPAPGANESIPPPQKYHLHELYLQISHDCNLKCSYCYAEGGNFGGPTLKMDEVTAKKAVDFFLEQLPVSSTGFINFDGGEPFLNWGLIETVVADGLEKARNMKKKVQFKIGTNGTLLNEENIRLLNASRFSLGISIDGAEQAHNACRKFNGNTGSYDVVEKNFITYKDSLKDCIIQARATITKTNLNVTEVVKHLLHLGFKHIYFEPVSSSDPRFALTQTDYNIIKEECSHLAELYTDALLQGNSYALNNFNMFIKRLHFKQKYRYKCEVARTGAAITPKGEIYPCYKFSNLEEFLMAHVDQNDHLNKGCINAAIQEPFLNNHVDNRPGCRECWARYLCGGGCAYLGFLLHRDIKQKDENECSFTLHMITLAMQIYVTVKNKAPHFWNEYFK